MYVSSLELSHFRNYERLSLTFSEGVTILFGDNAQGKTNLLEAIYFAGTTKSQRGSKEREVIQFGCQEAHLRMGVQRDDSSHRIDMHLKQNRPKGVAIDGLPIKKTSELFLFFNAVSFSPEDLSMIKNGPSERRRFLDLELCQLDKLYFHYLSSYNKILNQRNALLKQLYFKGRGAEELEDTLQAWDAQLISYGSYMIHARAAFVAELNEMLPEIHGRLTNGRETISLSYEPSVSAEQFEERLRQSAERDIALKMTNYGPHRDDICFTIAERDIRRFGSQGQQRTAALSVKLAEIVLMRQKLGSTPVVLLDDVLSELDRGRQEQLLCGIKDMQTIITCTGMEEFIQSRVSCDKIYQVTGGIVTEKR